MLGCILLKETPLARSYGDEGSGGDGTETHQEVFTSCARYVLQNYHARTDQDDYSQTT
jgi:hypothetical protein